MFNSSFNIYKTEWLDLVFSGRNKNYGAYTLRAQSSSTLTKSLFAAGGVFILLSVSPLIYNKLKPAEIVETGIPVNIPDDKIFKIEEPKPEKKEEMKKEEPAKVKSINMPSKIEVVNDAIAKPAPTIDDTNDAVISNITQDGDINPNIVLPAKIDEGNGNGTKVDGDMPDGNAITDISGVDEYPEFEGGMKAWAKYIQRNLRYPYQAQEAGTQGKVYISFVVEKDGSISNVNLIKGIGFGCDEEAIKVIKKSPAWNAGKNKGNPVRVRFNLPITFTLNN
ncbi:energy transducer TonB [Pedobacter aquatilis]|uniref:energy transducer TonB n=1 Tax=Pedobacter aquatilis TaxID=351343 RepID=UPI0025B290C1|nr:energy transducer TonB [Pedobacter aquatilis]MDN3587606.1 energy transducer TonB [Pedobacter aquatilis]